MRSVLLRIQEVDLIYDDPREPLAFEIASAPGHRTTGRRAFQERYPRFAGRCFLVSPDAPAAMPDTTGSTIGRLPLDWLLIAAGLQAEHEIRQRLSP